MSNAWPLDSADLLRCDSYVTLFVKLPTVSMEPEKVVIKLVEANDDLPERSWLVRACPNDNGKGTVSLSTESSSENDSPSNDLELVPLNDNLYLLAV